MLKAGEKDEEDLAGWRVSFSKPSLAGTRFVEEILPRLAALRALTEALGAPDESRQNRDSGALDGPPSVLVEAHGAMLDSMTPCPHLRQQSCPHCDAVTTQTRHGQTLSGRLLKGHLCACHGWECRGCGVVLDPEGECCR